MSKATEDFEEYFGLPKQFFHDLQSEDDWSLVVKLHALLETACSVLLAEELGHPEITDPFSKVQMGNRGNGKLAFIYTLNLLQKHEIAFLEILGVLRNKFAHNVASTGISLNAVIETMNPEERRKCRKALAMKATINSQGREYPASELVEKQPEVAIWVFSSQILSKVHLMMIGAKMRQAFISKKISAHLEEHGPFRLREGEVSVC